MSHSAKVTFDLCVKDEIQLIDKMINETIILEKSLNKFDIGKKMQDEISLVISELNKISSNLKSMSGNYVITVEERQSILLKVDSYIKQIENTKNIINIKEGLSLFINSAESKISELILKEGMIANVAINNIYIRNESLTYKNLQIEVDKIRVDENLTQEIGMYKENINNKINTYKIPREFLINIHSKINKLATLQELMDFQTLLKSFEMNYEKTTSLISDLTQGMAKLGFKIIATKNVILRSDHLEVGDEYKVSLLARNNNNNNIALNVSLDGTLEYKMGNYTNHVCHTDSDKLFELLKQRGRNVIDTKITRETSRSIPLRSSSIVKERGKK